MPVPTDAWVQIGAVTSPVFSRDGRTLFHLRGAGLPQVWVIGQMGLQYLDGNISPKAGVQRPINFSHSAGSNR